VITRSTIWQRRHRARRLAIRNIPGPLGVRGRVSDNRLIRDKLGWAPSRPLREGMAKLYAWIAGELLAGRRG
jgi:GDP-D-mannose 3', 5'-epimerase